MDLAYSGCASSKSLHRRRGDHGFVQREAQREEETSDAVSEADSEASSGQIAFKEELRVHADKFGYRASPVATASQSPTRGRRRLGGAAWPERVAHALHIACSAIRSYLGLLLAALALVACILALCRTAEIELNVQSVLRAQSAGIIGTWVGAEPSHINSEHAPSVSDRGKQLNPNADVESLEGSPGWHGDLTSIVTQLHLQSQLHTRQLVEQGAELGQLHTQLATQATALASAVQRTAQLEDWLQVQDRQLQQLSAVSGVGRGDRQQQQSGSILEEAVAGGSGTRGGRCSRGFGGGSCLDYDSTVHTAQELMYALRSVAAVTLQLHVPLSVELNCGGVRLVVGDGKIVTLVGASAAASADAEPTAGVRAVDVAVQGVLTKLWLRQLILHQSSVSGGSGRALRLAVSVGAQAGLFGCHVLGSVVLEFTPPTEKSVAGGGVPDADEGTGGDGHFVIRHCVFLSADVHIYGSGGVSSGLIFVVAVEDSSWRGGGLSSLVAASFSLTECRFDNATLNIGAFGSHRVRILSTELSHSRGGIYLDASIVGHGADIDIVDTAVSNHSGSLVHCGAGRSSQRRLAARSPIAGSTVVVTMERAAVVHSSPLRSTQRASHAGDAIIDTLGCSSWLPVEVIIEQTAFVKNDAAAVHTDEGALVVRDTSISGGESRLFSFGGGLRIEHSHFTFHPNEGHAGSVFNCRHIGRCEVTMSDTSFDGLGPTGYLLNMCAGSSIALHRVVVTGATGGGLIGCVAMEMAGEGVHWGHNGIASSTGGIDMGRWRKDGRCGPRYAAPQTGIGECQPWHNPCCSEGGWCGSSVEHCICAKCRDYSDGAAFDGGWTAFSESRVAKVEATFMSPHEIIWDGVTKGEIVDGGGDMYGFGRRFSFGGNRISTSLCRHRLAPWTDHFELTPSDCFGPSGAYRMVMRPSMMAVVATNDAAVAMDFHITGSTGADGHGVKSSRRLRSGRLLGYGSTLCGAQSDPSVNHLFVVDGTASPGTSHASGGSVDSDEDTIHGLAPGASILYLLYATAAGRCPTEAEHRLVFDAAVSTLLEPIPIELVGCRLAHNVFTQPLLATHATSPLIITGTRFDGNEFAHNAIVNGRESVIVNGKLVGSGWSP